MSGGERARIAIARSLLADHPVLVLDEPTAHLDHPTAVELAHEVLEGGARDQAVLWITHAGIGLDLVDRAIELAGPAGPWSHDEGDSARTAGDRDRSRLVTKGHGKAARAPRRPLLPVPIEGAVMNTQNHSGPSCRSRRRGNRGSTDPRRR